MADTENYDFEENPDINIEDEDFNLVVGDDEQADNDKTLDLEARNAELTAQIAEMNKRNERPAGNEGFSELAAEIRRINPAPKEEVPKGTDYNTFLREKGADFYKDPAMTTAQIAAQISQDAVSPAMALVQKQAMQISKLTLLNTPGDNALYTTYRDEVEAIAKTFSGSDEAYQNAIKQVKTAHMDELIEAQVSARMEKVVNDAEERVTTKPRAPLPVDISSAPRKPAARNYKIPARDWDAVKKWSLIKGFSIGSPGNPGPDQEFVLEHLREKGIIK